ncbi:Major facilitator superfamily protein [Paragonimus westermani]|uniref:Major facilitator superfamily protein n=1 Tax=Paragonimus westermani TaxID=34504 RepID=A0A8T0D7X6_9TREM|nr:Major facilitator superfamily protein [Paragonimus westermani]KAF8563234.1 Major facilitator superfamily protein [Paragonimus westermani]
MLFAWAAILISFPHLTLVEGILLKCLYTIWVCLMFFSLSGVFVIMPAALKLLFGPANLAVNYGLLYTAVSCGSIVSGAIRMLVRAEDAYFFQFTGCGCVCLLALFIVFWIEDRSIPKRWNICRWCSSRCTSLRGNQLKSKP